MKSIKINLSYTTKGIKHQLYERGYPQLDFRNRWTEASRFRYEACKIISYRIPNHFNRSSLWLE